MHPLYTDDFNVSAFFCIRSLKANHSEKEKLTGGFPIFWMKLTALQRILIDLFQTAFF